jgi:8-oxo-dGTP pyrophosphatase MutT (NUDIX family)
MAGFRQRLVSIGGTASFRLLHFAHRFLKPMTLGVRAIVLDDAGRVFLVRHSYVPGWHLPGGGIDPGETALEAIARELVEEGNIVVTGPPVLHGFFHNDLYSNRDHVAVYIVRDFTQTAPRGRNWEIVETGFFDPAALPEGTTGATHRRLAEFAGGPPGQKW